MTQRLDQLKKLHEADPQDPFCTYGIALELAKTPTPENAAQAVAWLDKTLAIDANYFYAYYQKARVLNEQGDEDAAIVVLNNGIVAARGKDDHAASEMQELLSSIDY